METPWGGGGQKVMQHRQREHENKARWEARDCDEKPETWRRAGKRRIFINSKINEFTSENKKNLDKTDQQVHTAVV